MIYFGVRVKRNAPSRGFRLVCENILFAHHGGSAPRRRSLPSQIKHMECYVVSEFLQAALPNLWSPQIVRSAATQHCRVTTSTPVVLSFFTPCVWEDMEMARRAICRVWYRRWGIPQSFTRYWQFRVICTSDWPSLRCRPMAFHALSG